MTTRSGLVQPLDRADLVVVGAGIVGLAHAVAAADRGLSVIVVERDERAVGASVRNFGHGCFTVQDGDALRFAARSRLPWTRLARSAGFWLRECGTVVVARSIDEIAVLEDLRADRGDDVVMLGASEVKTRVPTSASITGGAWLPADIRIDPRAAVVRIGHWLAQRGIHFYWNTTMQSVDADGVDTSRGRIEARNVVVAVAVGHDVDRHFPDVAAAAGLRRCTLHMLHTTNPVDAAIVPAVLTGWSMLRYDGFRVSAALDDVRARLLHEVPDGVAWGLNLMFTQRPDGGLTIGDTHAYARTPGPFQSEDRDDLVLDQLARLLGTKRPRVRERWQGVYASADEPFLVAAPEPNVRIVSVTSGVGMTTAFGLADEVLDGLASDRSTAIHDSQPSRR